MNDVLTDLARQFRSARNKSVPLIGIATSDPAVTLVRLQPVANGVPTITWDAVRGLRGTNEAGVAAISQYVANLPMTVNVVEALLAAERLPAQTIVLLLNAHRQYHETPVLQAIWNLRDQFKTNRRTLVLLGPLLRLPPELEGDVVIFEDPRPTEAELRELVEQQHRNAEFALPDPDLLTRAVDALAGLAAFPAENAAALSLTKQGMDVPALWSRKMQILTQTDGLRVERPTTTLADLGGLASIKRFAKELSQAGWYRVCWFIDEIEKDMAAMHTDTSGVSQYFHKKLLTFLQTHRVPALLLLGQPGTGKTEIARAIAGESGTLFVEMDMGSLKASHVGESETRCNAAFQTLERVSQGKLLFIATVNDVATLERSPELMRRFKLPKFYFDLPTPEELKTIWPICGKRHGVDVRKRPTDHEWTGAEIDACCEMASRLKVSVVEAAKWIVPMAVAQQAVVERRRQAADGKALNASVPGIYRMGVTQALEPALAGSRRLHVED